MFVQLFYIYYIYVYTFSSVPAPTVTITGYPIDEGFHTGLTLTFTARAEFNSAVDSPDALTVTSSWISPRTANSTNAILNGTNPITFMSLLSHWT